MLWNIGIGMVVVGLILLIISLILVFAFKIPDLLDELSGRKAKRQIKRLKELNIGTGSLNSISTNDFYMAISSSDSISDTGEYSIKSELLSDTMDVKVSENINNNYVDDEIKTQFMDSDELEESQETGYIEEDATGILVEKKYFNINILEEQSSLS